MGVYIRWLAVCVLLAIMPIVALSSEVTRSVHIVYVEPSGEQFTAEEQAADKASIIEAADWWYALSPKPVKLIIESTTLTTTTDDVYNSWEWGWEHINTLDQSITIFVIDNSNSREMLHGLHDESGYADFWMRAIWMVHTEVAGPGAMRITAAHELGHALYNLPDLYNGPCYFDIMCWPQDPYLSRSIGCTSLEHLGSPCKRIYIPMVLGD